jgi:integrase
MQSSLVRWLSSRPWVYNCRLSESKCLTADQARALLDAADIGTVRGKRSRAIRALCLTCGLRRSELAHLSWEHLQRREDHWAIVDLAGKGGHIRTVPVPDWVKAAVDDWTAAAGVASGRVFRCVNKSGSVWRTGVTEKVVWAVVKDCAAKAGIAKLAPHDLRRTCARLCHVASGELEQIQFLLGHVSVQTTEHYLGCRQRLKNAVNDYIGIEPKDIASAAETQVFVVDRENSGLHRRGIARFGVSDPAKVMSV